MAVCLRLIANVYDHFNDEDNYVYVLSSSDKTGFSPVFLIMPHYGISGKYPTYLKDTCLLSDLPVYLKDCKFNLTE